MQKIKCFRSNTIEELAATLEEFLNSIEGKREIHFTQSEDEHTIHYSVFIIYGEIS